MLARPVAVPPFRPEATQKGGRGRRPLKLLDLPGGLDGARVTHVVQVALAHDHAEVTSLAAATVVYDIVTLLAKQPFPI